MAFPETLITSCFRDANNAPLVKSWCQDDDQTSTLQLELYIPSDLTCLTGHFPSNPVLPGVVQIDWVCQLAKGLFKLNHFSGIKSVKYNGVILPEEHISLTLNVVGTSVHFDFSCATSKRSTGHILFRESAASP